MVMDELREDEGDGVDMMMARLRGGVVRLVTVGQVTVKSERLTKRVVRERLRCLERLVYCSHILLRYI